MQQLRQAIIQGEKEAVDRLVTSVVTQGHTATYIIDHGLTAAMNQLGEDFGREGAFYPKCC